MKRRDGPALLEVDTSGSYFLVSIQWVHKSITLKGVSALGGLKKTMVCPYIAIPSGKAWLLTVNHHNFLTRL